MVPIGAGAAWRASLLQQMGAIGNYPLIGLALLIYGFSEDFPPAQTVFLCSPRGWGCVFALEEFAEALQAIDTQAETLKQNAKTSLTKASISSISNLTW